MSQLVVTSYGDPRESVSLERANREAFERAMTQGRAGKILFTFA